MRNYYELLGISINATEQEIKEAYHKQARKYHPDNNPGQDTTDIMQELTLAYNTLRNTSSRRQYDATLNHQQRTSTSYSTRYSSKTKNNNDFWSAVNEYMKQNQDVQKRMRRAQEEREERMRKAQQEREERMRKAQQEREERMRKAQQEREERMRKAQQELEERMRKAQQEWEERIRKSQREREERVRKAQQEREERIRKSQQDCDDIVYYNMNNNQKFIKPDNINVTYDIENYHKSKVKVKNFK